MSWVFFLLLSLYLCARLCLRARGMLRLTFQHESARPRAVKPVPEHLALRDVDVWDSLERLAVQLDKGRVVIDRVRTVDPDAAFGAVRDGQYRITAIETRQAIEGWLRAWDTLDEVVQVDLRSRGIDDAPVRTLLERAMPAAKRAFRARALEAFPMQDVDTMYAVQREMLSVIDRYEGILASLGSDPYRFDPAHAAVETNERALARRTPALV